MSSIFARCVGLLDGKQISQEAAILVVERRSTLSYGEARVVVLDYLGVKRGQMSQQIKVSVETIRTYWKRIYEKTNIHSRKPLRKWVETILLQEIEGNPSD